METYVNQYKLIQSKKEYLLTLSIVGVCVRISCKTTVPRDVSDFTRDFTLDELKKIDASFSLIQTPLQALKHLDFVLKKEKTKVIEDGKTIKIEFYISSKGGKQHQLQIPLTGNSSKFKSTFINSTNKSSGNYDIFGSHTTGTNYNFENMNQFQSQTCCNKNLNNKTFEAPYIAPADDINLDQILKNENTLKNTETNVEVKNEEKKTDEAQSKETNKQNEEKSSQTKQEAPKTDERIIKLEGDANSLRNEQKELQNKFDQLTGELNQYKDRVERMERERIMNELNSLKAENMTMKQQLLDLQTRNTERPEIGIWKSQLSELNIIKSKITELSDAQAQQKEKEEMENLKNQVKELENMKVKYEEEIKILRETQKSTTSQNSEQKNCLTFKKTEKKIFKKKNDIDNKRLSFEEKTQQITVKGSIIHSTAELEFLTRKINKNQQKLALTLLYKATADSDTAEAFHSKCDAAMSTLVLVETDKGRRFGGYTTCEWSGDCIEKKDENAFVFSLDKMKIYDNIPKEEAIGCYPNFGPIFLGCQIRIYDNAFTKGGTTYERGLNYQTEEDFELNGGERVFKVKEIEVYEVSHN